MNYIIQNLQPTHWLEVARIYQVGIDTQRATFQSEVPTWEEWDAGHIAFGRLVACYEGKVLGWIALSYISQRAVYAGALEVSIYIDGKYKGMGIGTTLMNEIARISEENGVWSLYSAIIKENEESIALHKKCG
ncbi:MAG: N-acetyltransferase family protein [Cellulosilyticaceae bacterium]